jgi:hypothetical protein
MFTHVKFNTEKTNEVIVPKDKLMIVKFSDTFLKHL